MSLIITIYTSEGIVMASDSRISFAKAGTITGHFTDNEYKTFLCPNNCGISHCGASTVENKKLSGLIEDFIRHNIQDNTHVYETAEKLKNYIETINKKMTCIFHVAGYDKTDNNYTLKTYRVVTGKGGVIDEIVDNNSGAFWDGESAVLSKVLNASLICPEPIPLNELSVTNGENSVNLGQVLVLPKNKTNIIPANDILWNFMTLQDAIDFARYAITITIETMRFANVNKTVGGPIDILVIKPDNTQWIAHKELH